MIFQSGFVHRTKLEIERHASKVYTRIMFENFGELLIESTSFRVSRIEKGKKYLTTHNRAEKREKWCRVRYEVSVEDGGSKILCECGQFEHMGMMCSHILRVWLPKLLLAFP